MSSDDDELDSEGEVSVSDPMHFPPKNTSAIHPIANTEDLFETILCHKKSGLNFLVGSCEDLSSDEFNSLEQKRENAVGKVEFVFVDLEDEFEDKEEIGVEDKVEIESSTNLLRQENITHLSGDTLQELLSNQINKHISFNDNRYTDVNVPDYQMLIKFHEKSKFFLLITPCEKTVNYLKLKNK
jgi:hypothetical protein